MRTSSIRRKDGRQQVREFNNEAMAPSQEAVASTGNAANAAAGTPARGASAAKAEAPVKVGTQAGNTVKAGNQTGNTVKAGNQTGSTVKAEVQTENTVKAEGQVRPRVPAGAAVKAETPAKTGTEAAGKEAARTQEAGAGAGSLERRDEVDALLEAERFLKETEAEDDDLEDDDMVMRIVRKLKRQPLKSGETSGITGEGRILILNLSRECQEIPVPPEAQHVTERDTRDLKASAVFKDFLMKVSSEPKERIRDISSLYAPVIEKKIQDEIPAFVKNPKHGWCDIEADGFMGRPSNLTDVPMDLLKCFIGWMENKRGSAFFDEEGSEFVFCMHKKNIFVVETKKFNTLHVISNISPVELAGKLIRDIEDNKAAWAEWSGSVNSIPAEEAEKAINRELDKLKRMYEENIRKTCEEILARR